MPRYDIHHRTSYSYAMPVSVSHHAACLKPLDDKHQTCDAFSLDIYPSSVDLIQRLDYFGNTLQMFSVQQTHDTLIVDAKSQVYCSAKPIDLAQFDVTCGATTLALSDYGRSDLVDPKQFVFNTDLTPDTPEVEAFGQRFINSTRPIGKALSDFLDAFAEEFTFDPQATEVSTPVNTVLKERKGVCQDFAHLMIAALRACKLSARYASGYILTEPPEGQERLEGADASHAWVSVYIPHHGWIDIDPTNRIVCTDQHIKVAYGRDFFDVSMLKGAVTGGGDHTIKVEVTVKPVD